MYVPFSTLIVLNLDGCRLKPTISSSFGSFPKDLLPWFARDHCSEWPERPINGCINDRRHHNSWMVYGMESRIYKWMRTRGTPILGKLHIISSTQRSIHTIVIHGGICVVSYAVSD